MQNIFYKISFKRIEIHIFECRSFNKKSGDDMIQKTLFLKLDLDILRKSYLLINFYLYNLS